MSLSANPAPQSGGGQLHVIGQLPRRESKSDVTEAFSVSNGVLPHPPGRSLNVADAERVDPHVSIRVATPEAIGDPADRAHRADPADYVVIEMENLRSGAARVPGDGQAPEPGPTNHYSFAPGGSIQAQAPMYWGPEPGDVDEDDVAHAQAEHKGPALGDDDEPFPDFDIELPPEAGSIEWDQWVTKSSTGLSKCLVDIGASYAEARHRLAASQSRMEFAKAAVIVGFGMVARDIVAHGSGQVTRNAIEQLLHSLKSYDEDLTLFVGTGALFAASLTKTSQTAGTTFANAMGIKGRKTRWLVRWLPVLIALCVPAAWRMFPWGSSKTAVDLVISFVGKAISAAVRDPITQSSVGLVPQLEIRKSVSGQGWVPISLKESIELDKSRVRRTGWLYAGYFHNLRWMGKKLQASLFGYDKHLAEHGTYGQRLFQTLGLKILPSIGMEAADAAWIVGFSACLARKEGYYVSASAGSWGLRKRRANEDYYQRTINHGGMRANMAMPMTLLETCRDHASSDGAEMAWQVAADVYHGILPEGRGAYTNAGLGKAAAKEGFTGIAGYADNPFLPTHSVAAGNEVASERAELHLPPIGSKVGFNIPKSGRKPALRIPARIGTSAANMKEGYERLIVPREHARRLIDYFTGKDDEAVVSDSIPARGLFAFVCISRDFLNNLTPKPRIDVELGRPGFYPTKAFHWASTSCTVQDLELDMVTGELYAIFSSKAPLLRVPRHPVNAPEPHYRMLESELAGTYAAFEPLSTRSLKEGNVLRFEKDDRLVDCKVGYYWAGGFRAEDVRMVIEAPEPVPILETASDRSGTPVKYHAPVGRGMQGLWTYAVRGDTIEGKGVRVEQRRADDGQADPVARAAERVEVNVAPTEPIASPLSIHALRPGDTVIVRGWHARVEAGQNGAGAIELSAAHPIPELNDPSSKRGGRWTYMSSLRALEDLRAVPIRAANEVVIGGEKFRIEEDERGGTVFHGTNGAMNAELCDMFEIASFEPRTYGVTRESMQGRSDRFELQMRQGAAAVLHRALSQRSLNLAADAAGPIDEKRDEKRELAEEVLTPLSPFPGRSFQLQGASDRSLPRQVSSSAVSRSESSSHASNSGSNPVRKPRGFTVIPKGRAHPKPGSPESKYPFTDEPTNERSMKAAEIPDPSPDLAIPPIPKSH